MLNTIFLIANLLLMREDQPPVRWKYFKHYTNQNPLYPVWIVSQHAVLSGSTDCCRLQHNIYLEKRNQAARKSTSPPKLATQKSNKENAIHEHSAHSWYHLLFHLSRISVWSSCQKSSMYRVCSVTELNFWSTYTASSQQKPGMFCYLLYSSQFVAAKHSIKQQLTM